MKRSINVNIRKSSRKVPTIPQVVRKSAPANVNLLYNGAFEPYEDPADYLRVVKGGRIGGAVI